ncbi:right-handed parallel beta-helix repeat-containing protein [Natronosalvus halobius]|uniref:right-handed parallel beta-helix repeat-containing protein n=1 Tax=Natronosalvus halobius TaxID=2953746 RepID=UPI0020A1C4CD|nr:right-handed parallel beta-helix repeat-containing protein [Natronosalvus halobius]USZ70830.1 right-handed parallel beta-helix repeat-containing protein [Natronosalvus halobius]
MAKRSGTQYSPTQGSFDSSEAEVQAEDERRSSTAGGRSRRGFIGGVAAAGVSLAAFSSSASAYHGYADEYDNVVNIVDAGADNTGSKSITPVLKKVRADDTLLVFPEGRYYMDEQFRFTGFDNFGIVGNNATIVPANYYNFDGPQYRLFRLGTVKNPGRKVRVEGLRVDQTAPDTGIRAIEANVTTRLDVEDIKIYGKHDSGTWGPARFNVVDPNGTGRVVDFHAKDGGEWTDNTPHAEHRSSRGPIGIVANRTEGELMFRRCHLYDFPGSGLYAINGSGKIIVHGGVYKNSSSASLRVGGTDSIVRWPQVIVDTDSGRSTSQRGIRLESGGATVKGAAIDISVDKENCYAISVMNSCSDAWIENVKINLSGNAVQHGIVTSAGCGEVVIVDTDITHTSDGGYPLWARGTGNDDRLLCEYLTIDGRAGDKSGFRDAVRIDRDNCRLNACEIYQPGKNGAARNAVANFGQGLTIYKSTLEASQYPIVEVGNDTMYLDVDAESYSGRQAACLYDESYDVAIKSSRMKNGIRDFGSSGLVLYNNTY